MCAVRTRLLATPATAQLTATQAGPATSDTAAARCQPLPSSPARAECPFGCGNGGHAGTRLDAN